MDVSIIIVNWNTRDTLHDCLESVYARTREIAFEVIVIDNASADGSVDMIQREFPQVRLIANTENKGFAAANNQGVRIAQGRYMLLLNSDTIVLEDAIQRSVKFADGHLEAGVIGCRVLNADRSLQITCFMFPSVLNLLLWITYLYKVFPRSRFWGRGRMTWWDRDDVREVDVVTGCFMLVRGEAIDRVGLMDEQFFMYAEEADWCYRFHQAGYKRLFTPEAQIIHLGGASSDQVKPRMIAAWRKSTLLYFKKHTSLLSQAAAWTLLNVFYLTRVPYWVTKAAVGLHSQSGQRPRARAKRMARSGCMDTGWQVTADGNSTPVKVGPGSTYVLITPAYNEAALIAETIESVLAQTVLPLRWIVVDDGSADRTAEIVRQYAARYPWIEYCHRTRQAGQTYYGSNVYAILQGYERLKDLRFDYLAVLDADIVLCPDYYEQIMRQFDANRELGIATGTYLEEIDGRMVEAKIDRWSTPKALQVFRRACYEQIGGYIPCRNGGEDTCTEIMARMSGWQTWSFPEIRVIHRRPIGKGDSGKVLRARFRQGLSDYCLASHPVFMLAKSLRRCFKEQPYVLAGLARLFGFAYGYLKREPRQIPRDAGRYVRKEQMRRLLASVGIGPRLWRPAEAGERR